MRLPAAGPDGTPAGQLMLLFMLVCMRMMWLMTRGMQDDIPGSLFPS